MLMSLGCIVQTPSPTGFVGFGPWEAAVGCDKVEVRIFAPSLPLPSYQIPMLLLRILKSILFSHSVMSDSLRSHGLQHARLPCPSPTPGAWSNSCPLIGDAIQPSHPLLSPFPPALNLSQHQGLFQWISSLHQVVKALVLQLQHILPVKSQGWFPLGLQSLKSLLQHHSSKASFLWHSAFFMVQLSHPYITTGKAIAWLWGPLLAKWCLYFLMCLSRFVSFPSKGQVS